MARRRKRYDPGPAIRRRRRAGRWLIGVVMAVLLAGIAGERLRLFARGGTDLQQFDRQTYRVVHVVDGDTVHLRSPGGGETTRVRLLGLDAPELHPRSAGDGAAGDPGRAPEPAYWARNATDYLRQRLQDRDVIVRLEPLNHRDQYDRLLAYLYLDESDMVNLALVREGHAYADRRFQHTYRGEFERAEAEARRKRRGLWAEVQTHQMPQWRQRWQADGKN